MRHLIYDAIDGLSIKITLGTSLLGFLSGNDIIQYFSAMGVFANLLYNTLRIIKVFKDKQNKNQE